MRVDDLSLRSKSLIPLLIMAATVVAMIAFGALRLKSVSAAASEIIQRRDRGTTLMTRASRRMTLLPFSLLKAINFDDDSPEGRAAISDYRTAPAEARRMLDEAKRLLPERAGEIAAFQARFEALIEKTRIPMKLQAEAPGLVHGADLKPEELAKLARAAQMNAEIDLAAGALAHDITTLNEALLAGNAAAARALEDQARHAVWALTLGGLSATFAAGAISLWLTREKIAKPIVGMAAAMGALSKGDLNVGIQGHGRGDEIGVMAEALQRFKVCALARMQAEQDTARLRSEADAERDRAAAERARIAEEQRAAIEALAKGLDRLAQGDLTTELESGFAEAFARIRDDFNSTVGKLRASVGTVVESAAAIHTGTREIARASDTLSARAERQAANLEETVAALGEITCNVRRSADGAQQASQAAAGADAEAKSGADTVRRAIEAMDGIAKSSQQIEQIVSVIDEIAFQTNLLALNAGVEAARAGDLGKGFAVIASEVRALAQRSAEAAKEVKALIAASAAQVERGVKLVADSGTALGRMIAQVSGISQAVAEIAAGAEDQAHGLAEIDVAVREMDEATQQNASMAEKSMAASQKLAQETSKLAGLVQQFKLGEPREPNALAPISQGAARAAA